AGAGTMACVIDSPVVVTGLMGAGKTSVARLLAEALRRPLRDNDDDLEARYGMTAAAIAAEFGADELHARESAVLREALAARPVPVIAAAASTVEDPASRATLPRAVGVFRDCPPALLAEPMLSCRPRPHRPPAPGAI